MFGSATVIRELAMSLAKVIFMLKHSVKLRRYVLCGGVAACWDNIKKKVVVYLLNIMPWDVWDRAGLCNRTSLDFFFFQHEPV
jgi:hypothetical protein